MAVTRAARRRQRSGRVTGSVALLTAASAFVAGALAVGSARVSQAALVAVLVAAWATLRIMWTDVLAVRHEHALDRSRTARAAANLARRRAAQNDAFVTSMTDLLAVSRRTAHEMANAAATALQQKAQLEVQVQAERRRAADDAARIAALEREVEALAAEAELHRTGVSDLMSFEERVRRASTVDAQDRRLA